MSTQESGPLKFIKGTTETGPFSATFTCQQISRASSTWQETHYDFSGCLFVRGRLWCEVFCHSVVCSSILDVSIIYQECFEIVTSDKCDDRERSNCFRHYMRLASATPCNVTRRQDVESVIACTITTESKMDAGVTSWMMTMAYFAR